MHREDNSRFLLYIEPKKEEKSSEPINDEITQVVQLALSEAERGTADYDSTDEPRFSVGDGWRGIHITSCGQASSNCEYLLKNGMITNSLCVFYLQYYRNSIPQSEMNKVFKLIEFYKNK